MQSQNESPLVNPDNSASLAALVFGQDFPIPEDLYIPPEALRVVLQDFSGPLDLLLYLIRKQNINLLDIPIVHIAEQYNNYIEMMLTSNMDLASEYLVMATTLARIKSRMLLPAPPSEDGNEDEIDPRRELVDRLLEYERFNQAARVLADQDLVGRDTFEFSCPVDPVTNLTAPLPEVSVADLLKALERAIERQKQMRRYAVGVVTIDVQERIYTLYSRLSLDQYCLFDELFDIQEGPIGLAVNFFSILCLWNIQAIELTQNAPGEDIYLRRTQVFASSDTLRQAMSGNPDLTKL